MAAKLRKIRRLGFPAGWSDEEYARQKWPKRTDLSWKALSAKIIKPRAGK
jgi:hypothetical protein